MSDLRPDAAHGIFDGLKKIPSIVKAGLEAMKKLLGGFGFDLAKLPTSWDKGTLIAFLTAQIGLVTNPFLKFGLNLALQWLVKNFSAEEIVKLLRNEA